MKPGMMLPMCCIVMLGCVNLLHLEAGEGGQALHDSSVPRKVKVDASVVFFRRETIPNLRIKLDPKEYDTLSKAPREYVRCEVAEEDGQVHRDVGIRLKGRSSYQELHRKPSLTLKFDKFAEGGAFHGMDKIHINNSVQDPTYLCEAIGSHLFLGAGVPAARVTHARVWLNEKDLGLYVLKEGFGRSFIERHSLNPSGLLLEGTLGQDVRELATGDEAVGHETARQVLGRLSEVCAGMDDVKWSELQKVLDVERFAVFSVLETLLAHQDGYCKRVNNYRIHCDPATGKVLFIPHGMDQLLLQSDTPVDPATVGIVAKAFWNCPEGRSLFASKMRMLLDGPFSGDNLEKLHQSLSRRLALVAANIKGGFAATHQRELERLRRRLLARAEWVRRTVDAPVPDRAPKKNQ